MRTESWPGHTTAALQVTADYCTIYSLWGARRAVGGRFSGSVQVLRYRTSLRLRLRKADGKPSCCGQAPIAEDDRKEPKESTQGRRSRLEAYRHTNMNGTGHCHGEALETLLSQSIGYAIVRAAKQTELTTKTQN